MADPTAEAPAWLAWVFGTTGAAATLYQGYQFLSAKLKASTEEARAERKAARAEAAETDIIKRLEGQISRMQVEIDRLTKRVAEQDAKLEEFADRLAEAIDDRMRAIEEASRIRGDHVQLETRLTQEIAEHSALTRAHADLATWVMGIDLPESARLSPIYGKAKVWLEHNRARLSEQAA